ncbi:MAG: LLM class flavin-dependent oxidoreductase [Thermomicrobiales bacterium]|nr:LLM class flavin-dependent oxidoreductase [Thermomicrobiales bacterium]
MVDGRWRVPRSRDGFCCSCRDHRAYRLGTSITPAYPIHPITLASQVLALEGLAPGRIRLGIGTSHRPIIEDRFGIPMVRPLAYLREYLTVLRGLLWEGASEFSGDFFKVTMELPAGIAPTKTPVPISALRTNAFELAGELSDGAITWVTPIHYILNTGIPAMERGAEKAGRSQRPPVIAHVPVAVSADREAARQAFRNQFPMYSKLPFYAAMFSDAGFPVTSRGEMTDELVDELAVSGSEAEIRERLLKLHDLGIDELLISQVIVHDAAEELEQLSAILANRIL